MNSSLTIYGLILSYSRSRREDILSIDDQFSPWIIFFNIIIEEFLNMVNIYLVVALYQLMTGLADLRQVNRLADNGDNLDIWIRHEEIF